MDKRKLGAVVGVVGVAGVVTAAQFIDLDTSTAKYMTKDLEEKFAQHEEAQQQESSEIKESSELAASRVSYVVKAKEDVQEATEEQATEEEEESSAVEQAPEESVETLDVVVSEPEQQEEQPQETTDSEESVEETVEEPAQEASWFVGFVNIDTLNLRADASMDADIVDLLSFGDPVRGMRENGWLAVERDGEVIGYVDDRYVEAASEEEVAAAEQEKAAQTKEETTPAEDETPVEEATEVTLWTTESLRIRKEASTEAEVVDTLPGGAEVTGTKEGNWLKLSDGRGYVLYAFLTEQKPEVEQETPAVEEYHGYVKERSNVRKGPGMNYDTLGILETNAEVNGIIEGRWVRFEFQGQTAYISIGQLVDSPVEVSEPVQPEKPETPSTTPYSGYVKERSNVRKGPSLDYDIIDIIDTNTYVEGVLEGRWVRFDFQGQVGYISKAQLVDEKVEVAEPTPEPEKPAPETPSDGSVIDAMVDAAYSQVGVTYVLGAESPYSAFDCSGFTKWLYGTYANVYLPHQSSQQYAYGYSVSIDNLQPGDLLFYAQGTSRISHVALYVGGGMMVHARSDIGCITVDSIYGSYFMRTFVGARRILN